MQGVKWARVAWKHYHLSAPVDVFALADKLGIEVHLRTLPNKVAGIYLRINGYPHMIINRDHPESRKRWSVAHEIAHHLDSEGSRNTVHFYVKGDRSRKIERECDQFAAEILMPSWVIVGECIAARYTPAAEKVEILSRKFGVSRQAIRRRLIEIGMIQLRI
jgi:Zn-dependent peptidase ImmA (M78 family)